MKNGLQTRNNYDLFDVFDDFFKPMFFEETKELKTNILDGEKEYTLELALPGYAKEEMKISLENGYLTVGAEKHKEEKERRFLRREISESTSRSYYVGSDVTREDIHAKYENGILTITVPKSKPKEEKGGSLISID